MDVGSADNAGAIICSILNVAVIRNGPRGEGQG